MGSATVRRHSAPRTIIHLNVNFTTQYRFIVLRAEAGPETSAPGHVHPIRAETGRVFLLVVARDETRRRVVCVPAHYGFESVSALADRADATSRFLTHVLGSGGERVTLTHDDPGPFFPGGGSGSSGSEGNDAERDGDHRTSGSGSGSGDG